MSVLQQVTDAKETLKLQQQLAATMAQSGLRSHSRIRHRGRVFSEYVWWSPQYEIWNICLDAPPSHKSATRFWNAYGLENPTVATRALTITVETCVPYVGSNPRIAAAFANAVDGQPLLVHNGNIGEGGKFRSGFLEFLASLDMPLHKLSDGRGKLTEVVVVASLGSSNLPQDIARFVHAARQFKDKNKPKKQPAGPPSLAGSP